MKKPVVRSSIFQFEGSQAIGLPNDVAFPEGVKDVRIVKEGKGRLIVPIEAVWDDFFDTPGIELPARYQPEA